MQFLFQRPIREGELCGSSMIRLGSHDDTTPANRRWLNHGSVPERLSGTERSWLPCENLEDPNGQGCDPSRGANQDESGAANDSRNYECGSYTEHRR